MQPSATSDSTREQRRRNEENERADGGTERATTHASVGEDKLSNKKNRKAFEIYGR